MYDQNLIYRIGLTLIKGIGNVTAKQIIDHLGNPEQLFKEKAHILERIPGITSRVVSEIRNPDVLKRAEKEVQFIVKNKIIPLCIGDPDYPVRFKECVDSPVMLYFRGNADLNVAKMISVVGTRSASSYGREVTDRIIKGLASELPDVVIVSGLAYGTDYNAHQAALKENLKTVGILAHGLDMIYPYQHRKLAVDMLENGGLLTDFISETKPDKQNFVKRNRIIAGVSDCTIVIESAGKGGALITAGIADSYNKDVFAVPGKVADAYSQGCNKLIKEKKAALVENADDIMREMCWQVTQQAEPLKSVQRQLFIDLSPDQQRIIDVLSKSEAVHLNVLSVELNFPVSKLSAMLFELEMDGIVRCMPGGLYKMV